MNGLFKGPKGADLLRIAFVGVIALGDGLHLWPRIGSVDAVAIGALLTPVFS